MPIERTAEQERAAIVAWLRVVADDERPFKLMVGDPPGCALSFASDAIERGDHHSGETNNG